MTDLRNEILSKDDIKEKKIKVEEWDCEILVKGLTGKERSEVLNNALTKNNTFDFSRAYADLVIATAHDPETGKKIFNKTDRDALNNKSGSALEKIAGVAVDLSGLGKGQLSKVVKN